MSEDKFVKLSNEIAYIKKRLTVIEHRLEQIESAIASPSSYVLSKRSREPLMKPLKLDKRTKDQMART